MKTILIPTDFSNDAYNALYFASKLFHNRECKFILLNVYNEGTELKSRSIDANQPKGLLEQLKDESCEELKHTFHRINLDHKCKNHRYELVPMKGDLVEVVTNVVDSYEVDIIVMGNKGTTGKIGVFWGSSTTKLMNAIKKAPILAIPMNAEFEIPYEIAFATNYKRQYDAKIINPLCEIANICGSAIRVVHINEEEQLSAEQETNLNTLKTYLNSIENSMHWMPNFASKSKAIQEFLNELGIGMLVMVNFEHSFIEKLLREPIIKKLTFNLNVPFLVIPGSD